MLREPQSLAHWPMGKEFMACVHAWRKGCTSIFRLRGPRPLGGELERDVEIRGFDDPDTGHELL